MCAFVASNTSSHISSVSSSVAVGVDATPRADHIKFWRPHHWRARALDAATHHSCQCAPPLLSSVSWLSNWWTCCWRTTRRKSLTTRELPSFASRHLWCGAGRRCDLTIDDSDEDHREEGDGNAPLVRGAPCRCAVVSKCWASTPRRRGQGCWNNMTERYLSLSVSRCHSWATDSSDCVFLATMSMLAKLSGKTVHVVRAGHDLKRKTFRLEQVCDFAIPTWAPDGRGCLLRSFSQWHPGTKD